MALTTGAFVPEERKGGGAAAAAHGPGAPMDSLYNHATDAAMTAMSESTPANHPVTGTPLPKGTGAGTGAVRKGGRGGK